MSNVSLYIKNNQHNELFDYLLDSQINSDASLLHGFYHAAYEAKNFKAMEIIFDHLKKFPESRFMESVLNGIAYAMSKTASIASSAGMAFETTSALLTQMINFSPL